jgi:pilus assembly protein FimV
MDDDLELSLDDELSLEMEDESAAADEAQTEDDDFDLSMPDDEADEDREVPDIDTELSLDDDMELVLDDEPQAMVESDDASEADLDDIEDLDFELDAEYEDKPVFQASEDAAEETPVLEVEEQDESAEEELDLTDIEKMLEDDNIVTDVADASESVELDLEPEGAELWADEPDGGLGLGSEDEIDLSELEDAVNTAEQEGDDESFADGEDDLELDIDLEPETDEPVEMELDLEDGTPEVAAGSDAEENLDLSDMNLSLEEDKPSVETETIDGGDIQLEFQVDTADPDDFPSDGAETVEAAKTTAAKAETTGFALDDETFSEDDTITTELVKEASEAADKPSPAPQKKKGGAGKFLIILLVLAVFGGGGFFGYDYVVKNNINIPYLSDYINPEAKDPSGIVKLSTTEISGKFIENEAVGRIFTVTGKVRNEYSVSRKLIRLQCKLYVKGNPLPKTIEHTFAGLIVADQELSSKSFAEIKKQLSTTTGKDAAITVAPGKTIPFMVVFSELPVDLDQYDIELVSSIKAQ